MKGQVGRAINIHQALLQRPDLTTLEHAYVLLCLGLDFRHGGFVDRAFEAFQDVVRLDPRNRYALVNLQKLHEEQHQWADAARVRERILALDGDGGGRTGRRILGFLRNEMGRAQLDGRSGGRGRGVPGRHRHRRADGARLPESRRHLRAAGRHRGRGARVGAAHATRSPSAPISPSIASSRRMRRLGTPARFVELCERLIAAQPAGLAGAPGPLAAPVGRGAAPPRVRAAARRARPPSRTASPSTRRCGARCRRSPSTRSWCAPTPTSRATRCSISIRTCARSCRYRSTELLWQCPQCHEWNTFVEERLTPARPAAVEPGPTEAA